jgi:predicted Zn-dependent peptidase
MYHKTVLKNGVRVISERLDHFRSVSVGIWVSAGSRDEVEKENGISHFIEHMIFKGTHNRSSLQIAKELDAIGGFSNAFTGKEHTCFHSKVLDKHFSDLAGILSDIFLNSIFDPQDMDRERQVILQEINMVEDTPDEHVHVLFNRLFWTGDALGMPILVLNYFQPLFEHLGSRHEDLPRATPGINAGASCHHKDLEQVHICLGGKAPHLQSELKYASAILNTILGGSMSSRLFQEVREKRGLAYAVYSFISAYMDAGLMGVYVATAPQEFNHVLEVINTEIKKIQKGEVSKSDLAAAQEHLIGGIILGSENTDVRMMRLAKNEYVYGRYVGYEELVANLEKVTVDELIAVAGETFQSDEISLVTLGPVSRKELDMGHLQFS